MSRVIRVLALSVGLLLIMQGVLGSVAPDVFVGIVRFFQTPPILYVAAALRIAIGIVLLCAATGSRFPIFLRVFGAAIAIGGALTPFYGGQFAQTILAWWASQGPGLVRFFALASLVLGLFTAYAATATRRNA